MKRVPATGTSMVQSNRRAIGDMKEAELKTGGGSSSSERASRYDRVREEN